MGLIAFAKFNPKIKDGTTSDPVFQLVRKANAADLCTVILFPVSSRRLDGRVFYATY